MFLFFIRTGGVVIKLTVLEKILLHLYSYRQFEPTGEMPEETTLLGISRSININYSHVPRAMKRLTTEGLVAEIIAHTTKNPTGRRRKSYYLTENGLQTGIMIHNKLKETEIMFKDMSGKIKKLHLNEINQYLDRPEDLLTLNDFLTNGNEFNLLSWIKKKNEKKIKGADFFNGVKTLQKIESKEGPRNEKSILINFDHYPDVQSFLNRNSELTLLNEAILNSGTKILIIFGDRGIGKSALISKYVAREYFEISDQNQIQRRKNDLPNIYWFDSKDIKSENQLMNKLFESIGREKIMKCDEWDYNNLETNTTIQRSLREFFEFFNKKSLIIINDLNFDLEISNFLKNDDILMKEKFSQLELMDNFPVNLFVANIIQSINGLDNLKIIITTRKKVFPEILIELGVESNRINLLTQIELTGLDLEEIRKLLTNKYSDDIIKAIFQLTDGNPQLVTAIQNIDQNKLYEIKQLSPGDSALALILLAEEQLEKTINIKNELYI